MNRFFQSLILLFVGFKVINDTDFNYSYCNSYAVELGENEDGDVFILTLKVSFIVDAFSLHVSKYSNNRRSGGIVSLEVCSEYFDEIERARTFFLKLGLWSFKMKKWKRL